MFPVFLLFWPRIGCFAIVGGCEWTWRLEYLDPISIGMPNIRWFGLNLIIRYSRHVYSWLFLELFGNFSVFLERLMVRDGECWMWMCVNLQWNEMSRLASDLRLLEDVNDRDAWRPGLHAIANPIRPICAITFIQLLGMPPYSSLTCNLCTILDPETCQFFVLDV